MGLDTTHNCWHGSYTSFHRFREELANAIGMPDLKKMEGFGGAIAWESLPPDTLHVLLNHSDSDGVIEAKDCLPLAERLEEIVRLHAVYEEDYGYSWQERALQFAKGLRVAASLGENVDFQ